MSGALLLGILLAASAGQNIGRAEPRQAIAHVEVDGHVAVLFDVLPAREARELRPELRLDLAGTLGRVRFGVDALAQGLTGYRDGRAVAAASFRPRDAWIEVAGDRGDLRAGYGRVVWGRLDEVQPTDVVNPIDAAKFLLDGRSAARLPVWFLRGRLAPSDRFAVEAVIAPVFRRGTFDELDESSSPFNLIADAGPPGLDLPIDRVEPAATWRSTSGGARVSATFGRLDVAGAVFRGFEGFGVIQLEHASLDPSMPDLVLRERPTRFTMTGGDFETVVGGWALRGEAAFFIEKTLAGVSRPGLVRGRALDAGAGFDRRVGDLRVFGTVIVRRQWSADDDGVRATDTSVLGSIERAFGRERYRARLFGVVNPGDAAGFIRGLFTWSVRDNVSFDVSTAVFLGGGDDPLSRFEDRDFGFTRLTVYF